MKDPTKDAISAKVVAAHAAGFRVGLEHRDLELEWVAAWIERLPAGTLADAALASRIRAGEWKPNGNGKP